MASEEARRMKIGLRSHESSRVGPFASGRSKDEERRQFRGGWLLTLLVGQLAFQSRVGGAARVLGRRG
eukprot:6764545-Prymnesium_polylepis.1